MENVEHFGTLTERMKEFREEVSQVYEDSRDASGSNHEVYHPQEGQANPSHVCISYCGCLRWHQRIYV